MKRLRLALEKRHLTPTGFETKCGKNRGWMSRYMTGERGENLSADELFFLADHLLVEPRWLWTDKGPIDALSRDGHALGAAMFADGVSASEELRAPSVPLHAAALPEGPGDDRDEKRAVASAKRRSVVRKSK